MFDLGNVYEKDSKDCEYAKLISNIPICVWNCKPCIRVEYSLCLKYTHEEVTETDTHKVNTNE